MVPGSGPALPGPTVVFFADERRTLSPRTAQPAPRPASEVWNLMGRHHQPDLRPRPVSAHQEPSRSSAWFCECLLSVTRGGGGHRPSQALRWLGPGPQPGPFQCGPGPARGGHHPPIICSRARFLSGQHPYWERVTGSGRPIAGSRCGRKSTPGLSSDRSPVPTSPAGWPDRPGARPSGLITVFRRLAAVLR